MENLEEEEDDDDDGKEADLNEEWKVQVRIQRRERRKLWGVEREALATDRSIRRLFIYFSCAAPFLAVHRTTRTTLT